MSEEQNVTPQAAAPTGAPPAPAPPAGAPSAPQAHPVVQAIDHLGELLAVLCAAYLCARGKADFAEFAVFTGAVLGLQNGIRSLSGSRTRGALPPSGIVSLAVGAIAASPLLHRLALGATSLVLAVGLTLSGGCTPSALQAQRHVADGIAQEANRELPILIAEEEREGDEAIADAPSSAEASAATARVEVQWARRWVGWGLLRLAQSAYADLLDREAAGQPVDATEVLHVVGQLRTAWCSLRDLLAPDVALPEIPMLVCPAPDAAAADGGAR
jgi:hypothetical protein